MADNRKAKYVKRLANEGLKTLEFFRGLSPADWQVQIYTAGAGWTTQEILCHLLNAEQAFHHLLGDIMLGGSGAPENLPLDEFNEQQIQASSCTDPVQTLEAFSQARVTTLEIVRNMQPADLDRTGRHPFLGITTVDKMVQLIYRHVMLHQRDIRRTLEQGQPVDQDSQPVSGR
ncbi:DinB family protein [Chloroflexota bacterium]